MFRKLPRKLSGFDATIRKYLGPGELTNIQVRPVFAAWSFGFLVCLLLFCATLALSAFVQTSDSQQLLLAITVLFPCAPLAYFAIRGFRHGRHSAFEDLPQKPCLIAMLLCLAGGALLAFIGEDWGLALAPSIAAAFFALASPLFRELIGIAFF